MNSSKLSQHWYQKKISLVAFLLLPLSLIFAVLISLRRFCYRVSIFKTINLNKLIIVVGNITVGGTGKTPFVIWLANYLTGLGFKPGIVSRGVGGKIFASPHRVVKTDNVLEVGDEALLIINNTNCPLVICRDRIAAAEILIECDVIISDDGLQHYRLGRQIEIAIVDGQRRFGNQLLLPAGPLRESVKRLREVNFIVVNDGNGDDEYSFKLTPTRMVSLADFSKRDISEFSIVHAVAGIGNPQRFFNVLKNAGLRIIEHEFKDHYLYNESDLNFADQLPIVMTEKDSVKCKEFVKNNFWYLPVVTSPNQKFVTDLLNLLQEYVHENKITNLKLNVVNVQS